MKKKASNRKSTSKPSKSKKKTEAPAWLLENIAEASKNARKIYFLYIAFLIYCIISMASTTDKQIILNETAHLPLVNLEVSYNYFVIIAPFMLIFIFIYLQLYLIRIKRLISDLRANYDPVEKRRLYPWMMNFAEDPDEGVIGRIQIKIVEITLWYLLPLVLIFFAIVIIKKHDLLLSYIVGIIPLLGTYIVLLFWCNYDDIHKGFKYRAKHIFDCLNNDRHKSAVAIFVITFELFHLAQFIPFAKDFRSFCVDLSYQVLVSKPKKDYEIIYWLDLRDTHLEGADLSFSVLERANLEDAHLQKARIAFSNLKGANLVSANLYLANLLHVNLEDARLELANLQHARLENANLKGARLFLTNLQEANLQEADLSVAIAINANLQEADLQDAVLDLSLLSESNLMKANLQGSSLKYASLQEANLLNTNFNNANLLGTILLNAKGLTIEQLSNVKTLYQAELDQPLIEEIKIKYPYLLEKPDWLKDEEENEQE